MWVAIFLSCLHKVIFHVFMKFIVHVFSNRTEILRLNVKTESIQFLEKSPIFPQFRSAPLAGTPMLLLCCRHASTFVLQLIIYLMNLPNFPRQCYINKYDVYGLILISGHGCATSWSTSLKLNVDTPIP